MKSRKRFVRILCFALALLVLIAAAALYVLFPVKWFQKPSGPYEVGTTARYLVDPARSETFTNDPNDRRELLLQIWYPAKDNDLPRAPYGANMPQMVEQMAKNMELPAFLLRHLKSVKTHSAYDAEPADGESAFPVLLFSHGLGLYGFQNSFQMEELASQGYIVAAIQHPYQAMLTVFTDGRAIVGHPYDLAQFDQFVQMNRLVTDVLAKDASSALDYLERLHATEEDGSFAKRMDLTRVGMLGHSIGGAAAAQALLLEPRVKAAVNLDGTLTGTAEIPRAGYSKPFMQLAAQQFQAMQLTAADPDAELGRQLGLSQADWSENKDFITVFDGNQINAFAGGGYYVWLKGASHYTFTDIALYSPLVPFILKDKIDTKLAHRTINEYTLAFFDHYLREKPSPLLKPAETDTVKVTVGSAVEQR